MSWSTSRLVPCLLLVLGVAACGGGGAAPASGGLVPYWPTQAPDGLALVPGSGRLEITWNPVADATAYGVYLATTSGVSATTYWSLPDGRAVTVRDGTSVTVEGLAEGATYWCVVAPRSDLGEGPASAPATAALAPAAPTRLLFTAEGDGARLTWAPGRGATTHDVYIAADPNVSSATIGTLPGARSLLGVTPPVVVPGLEGPSTPYAIVVSRNATGRSADSAPAALTPGSAATVTLTAGNAEATLAWSPVTGAVAYDAYVALDPSLSSAGYASLPGGRLLADVTSPLVLGDLANGETVYALVVARGATNRGPDSATASATPSGRGTFLDGGEVSVGTGPQGTLTADLDADGALDLVVANRDDNTVGVMLGNGDGTFSDAAFYGVGTGPVAVVAADLDGNGWLDLATADQAGETVSVLLSDGAGGFQDAWIWWVGPAPVGLLALRLGSPYGATDLVVVHHDDAIVAVLPGTGDGWFDEWAMAWYATGQGPQHPVSGDFDGDGLVDLVTADRVDGTVSFLAGDGFGGFAPPVASAAGGTPTAVTPADFDADGVLDLVVTDATGDSLLPLQGQGDGTFDALEGLDAGSVPADAVVADFDGDGTMDYAASSPDGSRVVVFLGDGAGGFTSRTEFVTGGAPAAMDLGDFNGDGVLDLAVVDPDGTRVVILLGSPV